MKRLAVFVAAAVAVATLSGAPAGAAGGQVPTGSSANGVSAPNLLKQYGEWLFGSDSNPLVSGTCGEVVNGTFFLTSTISAGSTDLDCVIPVGVPVLASPGGTIVWAPTDGNTDAELLASLEVYWSEIADPVVVLDGKDLSAPAVNTGAFTMPLGAGSFIKAVDPDVPTSWTDIRVASRCWLTRLHPLTPGRHTLTVSDVVDGDLYSLTFHITVTKR